MQMPLPAYVGDTPPMGNVGKMETLVLKWICLIDSRFLI